MAGLRNALFARDNVPGIKQGEESKHEEFFSLFTSHIGHESSVIPLWRSEQTCTSAPQT